MDMERLQQMLTYCRPHGSKGEEEFVERFLMPYHPEKFITLQGLGLAYVVKVDNTPMLWSSHVDTVHSMSAPARQKIVYDEDMGIIYKDDGAPLGADDGAGVWLLLEMIDARVPGTYIFHRGEERGGIGSHGMAETFRPWLEKFRWAVAFDRRGTGDVITTQYGGRTASDDFAQAFADELKLDYEPCAHGVFTDTANYAEIIYECSNVSVGYDAEHTGSETLDVEHLVKLRDAVISAFGAGIDLPVVRDPYISYGYEGDDTPANARELLGMTYDEVVSFVESSEAGVIAELLLQLAEDVAFSDKH